MNDHAARRRHANARITLSKHTLRALRRALSRAEALSRRVPEAGEALKRLNAEARVLEACAAQAAESVVVPAISGAPRVAAVAREVLKGGEAPLTKDALLDALDAADLSMPELWAAPQALRVAISEAAARTANAIVRDARACLAAQRWTRRPLLPPRRRESAFFAHALYLCAENGLTRARRLLDRALAMDGSGPEHALRRAQEARAHQRLRLENLCDARRMLDALDWQACFEALSDTDAALRRDPAGVYPLMDDASRQRVRDQVTLIACATRRRERDVARHAVSAARKVRGPSLADAVTLDQLAETEIDPKATCCWWLCDDAGRRALLRAMGCEKVSLPPIVPDPKSHRTMAAIACISAALAAPLHIWLDTPFLLPAIIPAAWCAANAVVARWFPKSVKPLPLLKLDVERLPDPWRTLVVTPVLIPDAARAEAMCDDLETLGCLETDPNLDFLLLGDFADADAERCPGDDAIAETIRQRVAAMNRRAGREKYFYLHRPRTLLVPDGRFMGRDRKRGALMDLNRLLTGGESAFAVEDTCADLLRNRYTYVLTLDADTRMLPGTVHRLVGVAAHPMNRRTNVFQPRMETLPSSIGNRFAKLFFGAGGVDAYPTSVSSLWMDATGVGVFGGKGLYRVAEFYSTLAGVLPEGRILSHDLIEGALAGAAFLGDVALYDGCPAAPDAWIDRLHRWTRGDWQLLPMLFSPKLHLDAADRFRMLDNLLRSLRAPALWAFFACAAWMGSGDHLLAGLLLAFWNALLDPLAPDAFPRALAELAALPLTAWHMLDAQLRALWRLFVSGRNLLQWVPSADGKRSGRAMTWPNRAAALMMLPGLAHPAAIPMALGLFGLFWTGADWVRDMAELPVEAPLSREHADFLMDLCRDTWRFFSENTAALPPDNVQLDPPVGAARRTSPTNVGLYLLSCVAARRLGFIDDAERDARVSAALDALDRVEKWRGHLFNWIDIDALTPLRPRYVSAVDSGNLAACALACANAISNDALSRRLRGLAEGMDFRALYDEDRHLFRIGCDADADRPSQSHYDLLASESRILSFTALMLGQVPMKHWRHLGRACAPVGRQAALLSWSGTLFEYLMPELLLPAPALSLLGQSARAAVAAQRAHSMPWGVSESGFHAFDAQLNYQYRAFGLRELALSGEAADEVIAPYAAALALAVAPDAAAENLRAMAGMGWRGPYGFYEAADFARPAPDGSPSLVMSHMAHHQGMLLCAACNALTGGALSHAFMADPRARAASLLLEERPACRAGLKPLPRRRTAHHRETRPARRSALPGLMADVHLLAGRDARAFVTADGAVHYARGDLDATRFGLSLEAHPDAAKLWCRVEGKVHTFGPRAAYDAGSAQYEADFGPLKARMTLSLSPEDDTLFRVLTLKNPTAAPVRAEAMDLVPVALARAEDMLAHPAFQLLFVEAEPLGENGLRFRRRPRNPGDACPALVHSVEGPGAVLRATDCEAALSREGGANFDLPNEVVSTPLDPASALLVRLDIAPGETARLTFALRLCDGDPTRSGDPERAARLGRARGEALLGFLGLTPAMAHRLDRLAALLLDPRLAARAKADRRPAAPAAKSDLWALGVSGDAPILSLRVTDPAQADAAQAMLRAHSWYRAMGLRTDLILVDDGPDGYRRPVRDMLEARLDACALREHIHIAEGRWDIVRRASNLALDASLDLADQLRALLAALEAPAPARALDPGASTLNRESRLFDNGFGGFTGAGYAIDVLPGRPTPAPWCHILAGETFGILLTERGGGFIWRGNSRSGRLTPWGGDPMRERFGLRLTLRDQSGAELSLLPGEHPAAPFRAHYAPDRATYALSTAKLSAETTLRLCGDMLVIETVLNTDLRGLTVDLRVDWLMGTDPRDARWLRVWQAGSATFATGVTEGVGFCAPDAAAPDPGENRLRFAVGWAEDIPSAEAAARRFLDGVPLPEPEVRPGLRFETPDPALNAMLNTFLPHQVLASRVLGRTGYYQPGGAYGFRDQLQDMLALIPTDPERVRGHLLLCAGRQFAAGDVLHWWHMPCLGVRTRIRDDRLFLPFVTAAYVRQTGDAGVLGEVIPYLEDVPIPEDREDIFQPMVPGAETGTLHDHCMRAFRATDETGAHGLALMGAGDWNDGMNRVGHRGRGESVWLSMFLAAAATDYADICPDPKDAEALRDLADRHRAAVEAHGWGGAWYLRAFDDDGAPLRQLDLIAQAWSIPAGLDPDRGKAALDAAWDRLVDEAHGLIRLLDPPFTAKDPDPGYIRGYPPGVRENGAQYTHGACWLLLALIRQGDAERAHKALHMLLPPYHADTPEKAARYRVEPYVLAGDVCALPGREGRGGWTWYTGSAAWLMVCALELLGYERRGDRVRLNALLAEWPEASLTIPVGRARYRLTCTKEAKQVTLDGIPVKDTHITLVDDGREHVAVFPPWTGNQS